MLVRRAYRELHRHPIGGDARPCGLASFCALNPRLRSWYRRSAAAKTPPSVTRAAGRATAWTRVDPAAHEVAEARFEFPAAHQHRPLMRGEVIFERLVEEEAAWPAARHDWLRTIVLRRGWRWRTESSAWRSCVP